MPRNAVPERFAERIAFPWWIAIIVAAALYVVFRWVFPSFVGTSGFLEPVAATASASAGLLALTILALAGVSILVAYRRRRLLELETSLATIRALPHDRFLQFVAEAFRRQGYGVAQCADGHAGEADFVLTRDGESRLVQCRRWRSEAVDAEPVRRLYAQVQSANAAGCIFMTTGRYDEQAIRFAAGRPIRLVSGTELESMLRGLGGGL